MRIGIKQMGSFVYNTIFHKLNSPDYFPETDSEVYNTCIINFKYVNIRVNR